MRKMSNEIIKLKMRNMKSLHEIASIKDGHKRVGYIITDTKDDISKMMYCGTNRFEEYVKLGVVQLLTYKNGKIIPEYDKREKKVFGKPLKDNQDYIIENYWRFDTYFRKRLLDKCLSTKNEIVFDMFVGKPTNILGSTTYDCMILTNYNSFTPIWNILSSSKLSIPLHYSLIGFGLAEEVGYSSSDVLLIIHARIFQIWFREGLYKSLSSKLDNYNFKILKEIVIDPNYIMKDKPRNEAYNLISILGI